MATSSVPLSQAYPGATMFAYCTEVLHLSEAEAYLRIAAARASREHPVLLTMLADGRLHLTAIAKLAPHLTPENREALLKRAAHWSKRQIEELVAELSPRPDAPAVMRKLPEPPGPSSGPDGGRPRARRIAELLVELRPEAVAPQFDGRPTQWPRPSRAWVRTKRGARARTPSRRSRPGSVSHPRRGSRRRASSPSPRAATRSSSPPPPSFTTSSSGCGPSCAPRCPTATWPRSSSRPSPRSSRGSKPGASPDPGAEEDALAEPRPPPRAPDPGRGEASRVRAGRGPMSLRGRTGQTVHGAPGLEFHHRRPVRPWRRPLGRKRRPRVQMPQPLPGRGRLRPGSHGPASALEHQAVERQAFEHRAARPQAASLRRGGRALNPPTTVSHTPSLPPWTPAGPAGHRLVTRTPSRCRIRPPQSSSWTRTSRRRPHEALAAARRPRAAPYPVQAQVDRATLTGTVKDQMGAVIPGATVAVNHAATNVISRSGPPLRASTSRRTSSPAPTRWRRRPRASAPSRAP